MILNNNGIIILFIIFIFFISANLAWLNPRPDFAVYAFNSKIPLFWQYNTDASTELLSAAYFPYYFEENNIRMDRPGYPIIINLISKIIHFLIELLLKFSILKVTAISYILFKFFLFLSAGLLYFKYSNKYFNVKVCLLAVLLFFTQKYSIVNATTFHTTELSILTPVLIFVMFINALCSFSGK